MRRSLLATALVGVCLGALGRGVTRAPVYAQQGTQPALLMSAMQLPDSTRYSVTVANLGQSTLSNLQVSVQLPTDAVFDHALETPGYTQFQGNDNGMLSWSTGATFAPTDEIDAFTFFLQQPSTGIFSVSASWDGGSAQGQFAPIVQTATDTEADVTLDAATLAAGELPVGNTGVVILGVSGAVPDGTMVHVSVLAAGANPPASTGDLWWCSIVSVDGLPAGTGLVLLAPARQPLPPGASINLFAQTDSQWTQLDQQAGVTGDGQFIQYLQPNGTVAAGTGINNQPLPAGSVANNRSGLGARTTIVTAVQQQQQLNAFAALMQQPCNANQHPCNPNLPPCPSPFNEPNLQQQAGRRTCANAGYDPAFNVGGTTTCDFAPNTANSTLTDGANCRGYVPLKTGGRPISGPNSGTICTFNSIFDTHPFATNCTEF